MNSENSVALSLAVDELLTYIIYNATQNRSGNIEIWYHYRISEIEIIIKDQDGIENTYLNSWSNKKRDTNDDLGEVNLKIAKKLTDNFLFLDKGKDGREFRVVKELKSDHIESIIAKKNLPDNSENDLYTEPIYLFTPATADDAEDICKLIYRTYDYSYYKDDLYFPMRVGMAIRNELKFGVIARTANSKPAGYFAVIKKENSLIGEVGEAVVTPNHRKRGLMKKMLNNLIDTSRKKGLIGLYGTAVSIHLISQKVNTKFGFISTAIILGNLPAYVFIHMDKTLKHPLSVVLDYLPLSEEGDRSVYLPDSYESILRKLYSQFSIKPQFLQLPGRISTPEGKTDLHLKIKYDSNIALIIVRKYGNTFESSLVRLFQSLKGLILNSVYIDLPLNDPWVNVASGFLKSKGFIIAGIMPKFHNETDHLRMQKINTSIDFDKVKVLNEKALELKEIIMKEYSQARMN